MSDLKAQAEELGIKVDGRWSDERLQQEIDAKLGAPPAPAPKPVAEKKPPETLSVFLDYDTWIDDVRIKADTETPQELPYGRARELLAIGKARRADPLPGE